MSFKLVIQYKSAYYSQDPALPERMQRLGDLLTPIGEKRKPVITDLRGRKSHQYSSRQYARESSHILDYAISSETTLGNLQSKLSCGIADQVSCSWWVATEPAITLLKGQLQYVKAARNAVEDMAMGVLEELLDLRAEIRRYRKFEIDVRDDFMDLRAEIRTYYPNVTLTIKAKLDFIKGYPKTLRSG
jgi:hypothetical protein